MTRKSELWKNRKPRPNMDIGKQRTGAANQQKGAMRTGHDNPETKEARWCGVWAVNKDRTWSDLHLDVFCAEKVLKVPKYASYHPLRYNKLQSLTHGCDVRRISHTETEFLENNQLPGGNRNSASSHHHLSIQWKLIFLIYFHLSQCPLGQMLTLHALSDTQHSSKHWRITDSQMQKYKSTPEADVTQI